MSDSQKKQFKITMNLQFQEDKRVYEILKKQKNKSLYIRQAVLKYHDSGEVSKTDLRQIEDRIISEIRACCTDESEKQHSDQRADKIKGNMDLTNIKDLI